MPRPLHTSHASAAANRKQMPTSEAKLWVRIRRGACGARFRRQVPIGRWIADFAAFGPRLVIEVDGPSHEFADEQERTRYIESQGFVILRLTNEYIAEDPEAAARTVEHWVEHLRTHGTPPDDIP